MAARLHQMLWGTDAGHARSLAHPVRAASAFGVWMFAAMWLIESRQADLGFLVGDAVGSAVGAIVFIPLMKAWSRHRLQRGTPS